MKWMRQACLLLMTCMAVSSAAALPGALPAVEYTIPSGVCPGTVRVADDDRTVIFVPEEYFQRGEQVDVQVLRPGAEPWSIQLRQSRFDLTLGKRYIVAFDANASDARYMVVRLDKSTDPYTNYTRRGLLQLTRETKRFAFSFQMIDPSDGSAQLVFNMGQSDNDVTIDNVDVREVITPDAGQDPVVPIAFTVHEPFPNPFNPSTTLRFELPQTSHVTLTVCDILGREVAVLVIESKDAGVHDVTFDASGLASGIYLHRLTVGDEIQTRKLVLV